MNPATVLLLHKAGVLSKLGDRVYSVTPADAGVHRVVDAQMDARVRGHDGQGWMPASPVLVGNNGLTFCSLQHCIQLRNACDAVDGGKKVP